jgi:MoaA/NifB/PqqE/SkfB family radical SAM enzyme
VARQERSVVEDDIAGGIEDLLPDIGPILLACTAVAPTTLLTNGMLLRGRRLETLRSLPTDRLTLQISLDSPTPERHDAHRGKGTWARALDGIKAARAAGFRVRLAATVSSDKEEEESRR